MYLNSTKKCMKSVKITGIVLLLFSLISCTGNNSSEKNQTVNISNATGPHSIIYNSNGADNGIPPDDTNSYSTGQIVTVLGNPYNLVKSSYMFTGWNEKSDGSGKNYTEEQTLVIGSSDLTLYAKWTMNTSYTITYNPNGAFTGTPPVYTTSYEQGAAVIIPGNPGNLIRPGYNFAGWNKMADGSSANYTQGQQYIMGTGNVTLYALWTIKPVYNVIFNANGATGGTIPVDTTNYEQGRYVTVKGNTGNLVKTGSSFAGWNTRADGNGTNYIQGQSFAIGAANVTLYAYWRTAYSVTYNANGADGGVAPVDTWNYSPGASVIVAGNFGSLVKSGCNFTGWNTRADGNGTTLTQGQTFLMGSSNLTLYARWAARPVYTITYERNGASSGSVPVDNTKYELDASVSIPGNPGNLVKTGFHFAGWNTRSDGKGTNYINGQTYNMEGENKILYARWAGPGSIDVTFDPGTGADDNIYCVKILSDGKIIIAGDFTVYNSSAANHIARLNSDGTIDASFNSGTGADNRIDTVGVLSDGKLIIGGIFTSYNGTSVNRIARINTDGTLDTSFDPGTGPDTEVLSIAVQSDDKIIAAGSFSDYNGDAVKNIVRLNADGTIDAAFNQGTGADNLINCVVLQPGGKILIGGDFRNYNGTSRNRIARLNSDGTLDTGFNPGTGADNAISAIVRQSDGRILIGGSFTSFNGSGRYIARCNDDGTLDSSFADSGQSVDGEVSCITLQSDGRIIIGGDFTMYGSSPYGYIIRLFADGSIDTEFDTFNGADSSIVSIAIQSNGNILTGGAFTSYNGISRNSVTRILN